MKPKNPANGSSEHGPSRREPLLAPLTVLTLASGLIDAISYLGLGHVFTANMTGNVVILGFAAVGAPGFSVLGSLVSLTAFLAGAVCAGRLELTLRGQPRHRWVRTALVIETALLALAATVAFTAASASYALIAIIALAMGLRNGTVRKLAIPDVKTTVLTLTLTGLAADSPLAGGSSPRAGRRLTAVLAMLVGAVVGAQMVLHHGLGWPLLAGTVCAAAAALLVRRTPQAC